MRSNPVSFAARRSSWAVAAILVGLAALGAIAVCSTGCSLEICEVAACNTDPAAGGGGAGQGGGGGATCEPSCSPGANASAECVDGACVYTCEAGFESCDADPSDCEVDVRTKENCGACGNGCVVECSEIDGGLACNDPVEIAAGRDHTCVRKPSGTVFCWGGNNMGQIGNGQSALFEDVPQKAQLEGSVRASRVVAGGNASCILDQVGAVWCWGNSTPSGVASIVPSTTGTDALSVHGRFGVVLRSGSVSSFSPEPPLVAPTSFFSGASAIARGEGHGCAVRSGNAVHCWGSNSSGQLGIDPATPDLQNPTFPIAGLQAVGVAAGDAHSCARTQNGDLRCWGESVDFGQVGHGVFANTHLPQLVLSQVSKVKLGPVTSAALSNGELYLWGANSDRQVATTQAQGVTTPTLRADVQGVVDFALGGTHTCVLTAGAEVYCFGANDKGQLGVGHTTPSSVPVLVTIPRD
jgi:hypothetical protein